jgi:hypothetical protein
MRRATESVRDVERKTASSEKSIIKRACVAHVVHIEREGEREREREREGENQNKQTLSTDLFFGHRSLFSIHSSPSLSHSAQRSLPPPLTT